MATKGLLNWSKTAATNATADSQAQFAEGQAPSSLNDGIRGAMASMAMWRDDVSGSLTTGGTSTAYTVTTNQDATTLAQLNAQIITIVPHATNGASPTLAVNGLTAKSIRTETGVSVGAGVMIAGTPYQLVYFSSAGEFILMNFATNPYIIPVGALLPWTISTVPNSNFVFPYGQAISRTTYSAYFSSVSTFYGVGDSSTTFNILDLRGRTIAGLDNMGGVSADRLTAQTGGVDGDTRGASGGTETHTLLTAQMPTHSHTADHSHTYSRFIPTSDFSYTDFAAGGGPGTCFNGHTSASTQNTSTASLTTSNAGSGSAHNIVQPTIVLPYILRII